MQNERDVWNTTFYHRAIRKKVGEALSAGYDLSQPLPVRMGKLLSQLDDASVENAASERRARDNSD
jgi:hypothetical protein